MTQRIAYDYVIPDSTDSSEVVLEALRALGRRIAEHNHDGVNSEILTGLGGVGVKRELPSDVFGWSPPDAEGLRTLTVDLTQGVGLTWGIEDATQLNITVFEDSTPIFCDMEVGSATITLKANRPLGDGTKTLYLLIA